MALPGFRNHPKFRRLVAALKMPEAHVLGHVEMMWEVCYESGNSVLGDSIDVELAAGWVGEPEILCRALAECGGQARSGLIEEIRDGVWQVHDLHDHAPKYVESRRKSSEERRKEKVCERCGVTFRTADARSRFCSEACRKADYRFRQLSQDRDGLSRVGDAVSQDRDGLSRVGDAVSQDRDECPDHYQTRPDQPRKEKETSPTARKEKETSPAAQVVGVAAGGSDPPKTRKKPKPAVEKFSNYRPEVGRLVGVISQKTPKKDADGREIPTNTALLAARLDALLGANDQITPDLLQGAWESYLKTKPSMLKAPQYFFGDRKDNADSANWHPFAQELWHFQHRPPDPPQRE